MSSDLKVTNIKHADSGSNNLVLASDGNLSITNTLSAGTLGANVAFNDAHKDIRKDDYILLGFAQNTEFSTASGITNTNSSAPIWTEVYKGSGITHPYHPSSTAEYGRFKVSKSGIYLVWFTLHNNASSNTTTNVNLLRNTSYLNSNNHSSDIAGNYGGRLYLESASELGYATAGTKIIAVPLNANDYLNLYGTGNFYGGSATIKPMGQFGAIRLGDRV